MRKILLLIVLALVAVTSFQIWATKDRTDQKHAMEETAGQADANIGGDFTLTNQTGQSVHESDFRGKVMLVFFGFTHCPDICPVSVATMSKAMGLLGDKADQVAPLFITVDPQRDTPPVLNDFLANFDRHMIGLTGSPEQVKHVADLYKAYFARRNVPWGEEDASEDHHHDEDQGQDPAEMRHHHDDDEQHANPGDDDVADYTMDHSGYIYMMGKDGKYVRLFPYNASEKEIANAVEGALK